MSITILLVEDDRHQRYLMRALLELEGYSILEAANGREALDLFARSAASDLPALVITDNFMPEMDGFGLIRAIRCREVGCDIPVVLVSAADEDRGLLAKLRGEGGGQNLFVQKPFSAETLVDAVRRGVSGSRPG
ncbi:MAG: response regulator [Planctomycetes bacterium]|nr:response regulator [Planctomycetota bacterium]MBI3847292.1 response regulator [Planctomycetota bacterium]